MVQGKQTVSDEEITERMRRLPGPAFTTAELAEEFDMTAEGVRGRLYSLLEEGVVVRKKPSPRTVIWWLKTQEDQAVCSK